MTEPDYTPPQPFRTNSGKFKKISVEDIQTTLELTMSRVTQMEAILATTINDLVDCLRAMLELNNVMVKRLNKL